MRAKITNVEIGKTLGVQHTTISRYRSGDRMPSFQVMVKIATEFNWDLQLQAISYKAGAWHEGFEAALATAFGEEEDGDPATTEGASA